MVPPLTLISVTSADCMKPRSRARFCQRLCPIRRARNTNLLTDWEKYIAPEASEKLPVSNKNFMRIVGVIEILVGIGILGPKTEISSYAASAWLTCIAGNLVLNKDYDVAVGT